MKERRKEGKNLKVEKTYNSNNNDPFLFLCFLYSFLEFRQREREGKGKEIAKKTKDNGAISVIL